MLGGLVFVSNAQSAATGRPQFEQLDAAAQRMQVQLWMNQSLDVELPAEAIHVAHEFYGPGTIGENLYKKNRYVLSPLYNAKLSTADRLSYCNYLLLQFAEEEIPLDLVRICKSDFMNPVKR